MNEEPMITESNNPSPQSVVDSASITNSLAKNKESLKLKLMLRRPMNILVDQGILPPPNSSPTFHEQKLKLERAKTGDYLKHKIQRRPQRDELIQQHILEDNFDPSYYEQERKLKRARLADDLNERLSHRPGPLELIKGNILHTDETLEQAIKDGQITFKKTCEGEIIKNPPKRFVFEEESSSDSAPSPSLQINNNNNNHIHCNIIPQNLNLITTSSANQIQPTQSFIIPKPTTNLVTIPTAATQTIVPTVSDTNVLNAAATTNLSYIVTAPVTNVLPTNSTVFITTTNNNSNNQTNTNNCLPVAINNNNNNSIVYNNQSIDSSSTSQSSPPFNFGPTPTPTTGKSILNVAQNNNNHHHQQQQPQKPSKTKKIKSKTAPKTRIIKFHEYKGPPNARRSNSHSQQSCSETSYELLLKQQQLFLQWQLESRGQQQQQQQNDTTVQNMIPIKDLPDSQPYSLMEESNRKASMNDINVLNNNNNNNLNNSLIKNDQRNNKNQQMILNTNSNTNNEEQSKSLYDNFDNKNNNKKTGNKSETKASISIQSNNLKNSLPNVKKIISKLEDMKVSDLKAELKKRNLPVSGAKQQLIERLKPFSESVVINNNAIVTAEMNGCGNIGNIFHQSSSSSLNKCSNNNNNNLLTNTNCTTTSQQFIYQDLGSLASNTTNHPTTTAIILNNNNENFQTIPTTVQLMKPTTANHSITLDGTTTLTIPIGNTFTLPQYQVLAPTPVASQQPQNDQNNKIQVNGLNITTTTPTNTSTLANNILINNKFNEIPHPQPANLNYSSTAINSSDHQQSNPIILASPRIQLAQLSDGTTAIIQPTTTLNQNPVFHQLLLYPNTINATNVNPTSESTIVTKHNRSNSLPGESMHPLQRNTSLPLIINQMPISQITTTNFDPSTFKLIKVGDNISTVGNDSNNKINNNKTMQKTKNIVQNNIMNPVMKPEMNSSVQNMTKIIEETQNKNNNNNNINGDGFQTYPIQQNMVNINDKNPPNTKIKEITPPTTTKINSVVSTTESTLKTNNVDNCFNKNSLVDSSTSSSTTSNHIQPDSTTNNNNELDLDFMLNFDDLNEFDVQINRNNQVKNNNENNEHKGKTILNHSDEIIEFNDSWLDFTFDEVGNNSGNDSNFFQNNTTISNDMISTNNNVNNTNHNSFEQKSKTNLNNNNNNNNNNNSNNVTDDNLLFDQINQIFNDNIIDNNNHHHQTQQPSQMNQQQQQPNNCKMDYLKNNHHYQQQQQQQDYSMTRIADQQQFNGFNDSNVDFMNNNNNNNNNDHFYQNNNLNLQQYDFNFNNSNHQNLNNNGYISNCNNNNNNNIFNHHNSNNNNNHNQMFNNMDSFNDLFFEDNDFKTSMDFPILLDKIDFAT